MSFKFSKGEGVSYKPKRSPVIEMKNTVIAAREDLEAENRWEHQYCELSKTKRWQKTDAVKTEPRYIVEHFWGWYPSVQKNLSPEVKEQLDISKRYYFAFESELKSLRR